MRLNIKRTLSDWRKTQDLFVYHAGLKTNIVNPMAEIVLCPVTLLISIIKNLKKEL